MMRKQSGVAARAPFLLGGLDAFSRRALRLRRTGGGRGAALLPAHVFAQGFVDRGGSVGPAVRHDLLPDKRGVDKGGVQGCPWHASILNLTYLRSRDGSDRSITISLVALFASLYS